MAAIPKTKTYLRDLAFLTFDKIFFLEIEIFFKALSKNDSILDWFDLLTFAKKETCEI